MILDEATAMLDPAGRADVLATVRKLNREQGMTVIWITHFMEEAAVADRVVVLDKGKIALDGTPAGVFSQVDRVKALGLDVPPHGRAGHAPQRRRSAPARRHSHRGRYGKGAEKSVMPIQVEHLTHTYMPGKPLFRRGRSTM